MGRKEGGYVLTEVCFYGERNHVCGIHLIGLGIDPKVDQGVASRALRVSSLEGKVHLNHSHRDVCVLQFIIG
mgnify:CR=1 FL=1